MRSIYLLSINVALIRCGHVQVPDTEVCSSAGVHGALCAHTISQERRRLTIEQWIDFLEANGDNKGPAVCQSSIDYMKVKTALEQLCQKAGDSCAYEDKKMISDFGIVLEKLQKEAEDLANAKISSAE